MLTIEFRVLNEIERCTPISIWCLFVLKSTPNHIVLKHTCMFKKNNRIRPAYLSMTILWKQIMGFAHNYTKGLCFVSYGVLRHCGNLCNDIF